MSDRLLSGLVTLIVCLGFAMSGLGQTVTEVPKESPKVAAKEPVKAPEKAPASSWDKYKVLAERNLFLKDRSHRSDRPRAPVYPPEHFITLRGIVRQGDEYVAFLEDARSGATTRVAAKSPAATGHIVSLGLDYVEYEKDGKTAKITIGQNFEGGEPAQSSGAVASSPGAASTATQAPTAASGEEATALERMRQRREKELNKK